MQHGSGSRNARVPASSSTSKGVEVDVEDGIRRGWHLGRIGLFGGFNDRVDGRL